MGIIINDKYEMSNKEYSLSTYASVEKNEFSRKRKKIINYL